MDMLFITGLLAGTVAGIVIGVVAVLVAIIIIIIIVVIMKREIDESNLMFNFSVTYFFSL